MQNQLEQKQQVQKGWLSRWTRKQWSRHWFVLKSGSLTYYRGPAAELCSFLDGVLDLSLIKHIEVHQVPASKTNGGQTATTTAAAVTNPINHLSHPGNQQQQQQQQQPFTFSLKMWSGECHLLSAASLAERSIWLEAINSCTNGCLLDDEASTDSASSTDSSPTSNLSTRSCDIGLSAIRYRTILSHQQQQQQNDQVALDKLAMSLRTAMKRREQEPKSDFSSCVKSNNNNNSETNPISKQQQHNKQVSSQHQPLLQNHTTIKTTSLNEPPHSTSQPRDGIFRSRVTNKPSSEASNNKQDAADDGGGGDQDDEDEEINDDDDEDDEENGGEIEKNSLEDEEEGEEDENEADESETDDDDAGEVEEMANQAFKRRLMCVPQVSSASKCHTEPKLISRLAAADQDSSSSSDDDEDDDGNGNGNNRDINRESNNREASKEQQQQLEQCKKQRKRVTFDLSQSTQRLLTSSSSSGGSDSDTSSQSYGESSSESSLSSVELADIDVDHEQPEQSMIGDGVGDHPATTRTDTGPRLLAGLEDGAGSAPSTCLASGAICPMDTTNNDDDDDNDNADDWQVLPSAAAAAAPSATLAVEAAAEAGSLSRKGNLENRENNDRSCRIVREQVARIEELELRYERAQASIGLLEMRLSNSCASYAQLELTYARLQNDLVKRDELNRSEAGRLQARIEELQHQLAASELKLLEARDRLLEFEQQSRQQQQQQQQQQEQQRTSANMSPRDAQITTTTTTTTTTTDERNQLCNLSAPLGTTKPAGSWLKQINQQQQQKPLFLMHHVRHTLVANQQTIGLKLLNQSKQIQRKLNELELKVDKINQPASVAAAATTTTPTDNRAGELLAG